MEESLPEKWEFDFPLYKFPIIRATFFPPSLEVAGAFPPPRSCSPLNPLETSINLLCRQLVVHEVV